MKRLLPILLLLLPISSVSAYTSYKTVSFGPSQTAQTVTYTVKDNTNTTVSAGVSGTVIELGGGAYASAITVPDGANYFIVWSETNSGTTYTASDKIDAQATAALATLANQTSIIATTASTNTLATGINTKTSLIATNAADSPNAAAAQGNASTLLLSLATYQSVLTAGSTSSVLSTALVGTADLTGAKVVFTTGVNKGVTRTITSMNSGTGAINLLTAMPVTPGATDAFSVVQGSKALEQFLAALGADSKPFLTATDTQAQAEAVAALVAQGYTVTRAAKIDNADAATSSRMATFTYTAPSNPTDYQQRAVAVTLPTTAPTGYGGGSTGDTPGTTTLLARVGTPAGASLAADIAAVKTDTGNLVTGVAALPAAVWTYTASDGLTHQQSDALRTAILARGFSVSYNAATRTQVTTYVKADGVTALATTTVVYDTTGRAMTRTTAFTNLP